MIRYKTSLLISLLFLLSCQKELSITEFSDDFSNYESELRIEALILPTENTAIVRIDKSYTLMDTTLYDCIDNDFSINGEITLDSCNTVNGIWHGDENSTIAHCGNWNYLIHDLGIDGEIGDPTDDDGDCENCNYDDDNCLENCRKEDSIGENNGVPDCNEPNVDNYTELLSETNVHENSCEVSMTKIDYEGSEETCYFYYNSLGGNFFDDRFSGSNSQLIDDKIVINYGAFLPRDNCSSTMWSDIEGKPHIESEYSFNANCEDAGFGNITSKEPITVSNPVVFVDTIFDPLMNIPKDQSAIIEYLINLGIQNCNEYDCLEENKLLLENNSIYFPRNAQEQTTFILWASITPDVYFQATQYMYDSDGVDKNFHGHPAIGTDFLNIVNNVCLMSESVVPIFYDGYGNNIWDVKEVFADSSGNGEYDIGEYFIDQSDGIGDIDKYYYEISTFSESYKNYYFYSQLLPYDPVRSNLRNENNEFIMGAFGSITTNKIDIQIIDCMEFSYDSDQNIKWDIETEDECENPSNTHGVCQWFEEQTVEFFNGPTYNGSVCAPINFYE